MTFVFKDWRQVTSTVTSRQKPGSHHEQTCMKTMERKFKSRRAGTEAKLRLLMLTAALAIVGGCSAAKPPTENVALQPTGVEPVAVTVSPVTVRALQRRVEIVGNFEGFEEITVSGKVDGLIQRIHREVSDTLEPGELLLEIDGTDYLLAANEAEQALAADLARLGLDKLPPGELEITRLPSVERARAMLANSEIKFGRAGSLANRNAITPEMRDQAEADFNVARAEYRQAELEAKATLASARHKAALLATARQRLADTKIVVPMPTRVEQKEQQPAPKLVVAERFVSEGELVQSKPATKLFRLVIDNPLKLKVNVPERYSGEIKLGQTVEIAAEAYPGETFRGHVSRISPTINRLNRTIQIEVRVENDDHRLRPGNFAKAAVLTREEDRALTVPLESLVSFAGVNKVFIVKDQKAWAVEVQPGVRGEGWLEVIGELDPAALVVTSGATRLADGTPVRVRTDPATTAKHAAETVPTR